MTEAYGSCRGGGGLGFYRRIAETGRRQGARQKAMVESHDRRVDAKTQRADG